VDAPPPRSRLEKYFDNRIHEETLKPLLPVIQGLMRFRPSDRISLSQALDMVRRAKDEMDEAEDEMDEAEDGVDGRDLSALSSHLCTTPAGARVEVA
jgi:hypothetical protein